MKKSYAPLATESLEKDFMGGLEVLRFMIKTYNADRIRTYPGVAKALYKTGCVPEIENCLIKIYDGICVALSDTGMGKKDWERKSHVAFIITEGMKDILHGYKPTGRFSELVDEYQRLQDPLVEAPDALEYAKLLGIPPPPFSIPPPRQNIMRRAINSMKSGIFPSRN